MDCVSEKLLIIQDEQSLIAKILVKQGKYTKENYSFSTEGYVNECLSIVCVFGWCEKFKGRRNSVHQKTDNKIGNIGPIKWIQKRFDLVSLMKNLVRINKDTANWRTVDTLEKSKLIKTKENLKKKGFMHIT